MDSENIGWSPPQKASFGISKESELNLINNGGPWVVIVFSRAPNKKTTVYRNLQSRKVIVSFIVL